MTRYLPKLCKDSSGNVKVELDLPKCSTKAGLIKATGIDRSKLASKTNLAGLKTKVDKLDLGKLTTAPAY